MGSMVVYQSTRGIWSDAGGHFVVPPSRTNRSPHRHAPQNSAMEKADISSHVVLAILN